MNASNLKKEMFKGFNTYYNDNALTHVCMPECFAVSLGFKFYNGTYGKGMLLTEALMGFDNIHPGVRSYDGTYTELTLYSHDHEIFIQSAVIDDNQHLLITPVKIVKTPPALIISASVLWNRPGYVEKSGDSLSGVTPEKTFCVLTDGKYIREMNTGILNPYIAAELSSAVAVSTGRLIKAAELKELMQKKKESLKNEIERFGELSEAYNAMRTCLAWDTIYEPENDRICSPVSRAWSKWWSGYVLFCWDTYFAAMLAMPDNKNLAYANLIAITHEKTEAGFVPNFGSVNPESIELRERAELSKNGLETLWDEEFGIYLNRRTDTGEFSRRISPTNFYALFSDKVSKEHAERMVKEHFFNENEFYGEYMMPSIARNDPAYAEQNYWRGCIWAPMNFLVYLALRNHKLTEACSVLTEKSKNLLLLDWNLYGHVHENYHGDTGMGCDSKYSNKFYHWGALLSLIALIDKGYVEGPEIPLIHLH